MKNESAREPAPIHAEKCFLNAIAEIAGLRLIGLRSRFAQSSRFVRKERIATPIRVLSRRENFSLTRKILGATQEYVDTAGLYHLAIAGSRLVALSTCGRICVLLALSWIGARGSFATPGSITKV